MLTQFFQRHNIVLHKGQNLHIVATLLWNRVLMARLAVHKRLHGIKKPIVHYYAVCWNEEKMLPFMFQYYDQFVDHYTIYDNYSDDNSESIIRSHKNADIVKFQTDGFDDTAHQNIKNNCWKRSRGKADWVVVCDIDEFLYHEDLVGLLRQARRGHYTIFRTTGYHMYSATYPCHTPGRLITNMVKDGVHDFYFDKQIVFDPHRIAEINYEVGGHQAHPKGMVRELDTGGTLKMLHYKNLSVGHLLARMALCRSRLSKANLENRWGEHYLQSEAQVREDFAKGLAAAQQVIP